MEGAVWGLVSDSSLGLGLSCLLRFTFFFGGSPCASGLLLSFISVSSSLAIWSPPSSLCSESAYTFSIASILRIFCSFFNRRTFNSASPVFFMASLSALRPAILAFNSNDLFECLDSLELVFESLDFLDFPERDDPLLRLEPWDDASSAARANFSNSNCHVQSWVLMSKYLLSISSNTIPAARNSSPSVSSFSVTQSRP